MAWKKEAITDGEIDALCRTARAACADDTRYPLWRAMGPFGGQCYVISRWLTHRLGGHVGAHRGHYVWLSPDHSYYIDLTGGHRGVWVYERNSAYKAIGGVDNERTTRFAKRANRIFDSLDKLMRLSLDYAGDAYPAEEPQAADDSDRFNDSWTEPEQYWHDEPDPTTPQGVYQFIYANGQLEVSPNHAHSELADHVGIDPSAHTGPFAAGHVVVTQNRATWEVQANVNLHAFLKILKEGTKNYGWTWGGMTDANGQPITDQFGPKKSGKVFHYVFGDGHLLLGRTSAADLVASSGRDMGHQAIQGTITIFGERALVSNVHVDALPSLFEYAEDHGLTLYAGNDNVIKTIPTLEQHNLGDPNPLGTDNPVEPSSDEGRLPTGLYRCPACSQLFPNWHEYQKHRREQESWGDPDRSNNGDRGLPEPDPGQFGDGAHFTEMRQEPGITTGAVYPKAPCPTCNGRQILDQGPPIRYCPTCAGTGEFPQLERIPPLGGDEGYATPRDQDVAREFKLPIIDAETSGLGPRRQGVVVLPARTWKEAARVDGFMKYATAFKYANNDFNFYVAYRNGDPIAYAAVKPDGYVHMMHSAVEKQGAATAIFHKLTKHFSSLYTGAANLKVEEMLRRHGWMQADKLKWKWSADKAPAEMLESPMPFIYDVQDDKIFIGHPGARTSDIPGRFTPGGIVEGMYEPGGKVVIRSLTSIPYTVRHMIELWYYTHPHMEVKSVHLQDDAGKDTRLASAQKVAAHVRTLATIDPAVYTAATALNKAGGGVYAVGGAIRDTVLGKAPHDIDLMVTRLSAEETERILDGLPGKLQRQRTGEDKGSPLIGEHFGTFLYRYKGHEVEIALPRRERSTGPGHNDFQTEFDPKMKPEDDLYRRDFTANAMAVNVFKAEYLDPFGGAKDIAGRILRTLSPHSFADDPLRIVRALVAHARDGLVPDDETRRQMTANADGLLHLPAERIQHELDKLMETDDPASAIYLAHQTGVLKHILPEVDAAFGFDQNNKHHELHLGDHLVHVLARIATKTKDKDLRLAALLHDIGKPASEWKDPETGHSHYYAKHEKGGTVLGADHHTVGAQMVRERLNALRYPKDRIKRIVDLVENHMYAAFTTQRGARRFLSRVGTLADDLFLLRWADQGGKSVYPSDPVLSVENEKNLVDLVRNAKEATTQSQLAINGRDLIQAGIEPGPIMGKILSTLTERVLDDPLLNTPGGLLPLAQEHAKLYAEQS